MPSVPAIRVQRLSGTADDWPLPAYETSGAAGADLRAHLPDGPHELPPGARCLIPSGLAMEIPKGYEIQVRPRSGLALKQGVTLLNSPGTIDSDYRGEVSVILYNASAIPVTITHGMRIAQLVVAAAPQAEFFPAPVLSDSARGSGGFGSTGGA